MFSSLAFLTLPHGLAGVGLVFLNEGVRGDSLSDLDGLPPTTHLRLGLKAGVG